MNKSGSVRKSQLFEMKDGSYAVIFTFYRPNWKKANQAHLTLNNGEFVGVDFKIYSFFDGLTIDETKMVHYEEMEVYIGEYLHVTKILDNLYKKKEIIIIDEFFSEDINFYSIEFKIKNVEEEFKISIPKSNVDIERKIRLYVNNTRVDSNILEKITEYFFNKSKHRLRFLHVKV